MKPIYKTSIWSDYADAHLACPSMIQLELYRYITENVFGRVVDLGCGSGRLGAIMQLNPKVTQYIGIDASKEMIEAANRLSCELNLPQTQFTCSTIEDANIGKSDCIVSVNSFYTWERIATILAIINAALSPGGVFVLATPNHKLDMPALIKAADLELVGNPMYGVFKSINKKLAENTSAQFLPMDELISMLVHAGFRIQECNQKFFNGGMNTIVMTA